MSAEQAKGKGKTKAPMEAIQAYLEAKGKNPKGKGAKEKIGPMRMKKSLLENLAKKAPGHWTH